MALRSMMEKIDELKGEMPEGTYLKLCDEAKRQFETDKARPELYEVTYVRPVINKETRNQLYFCTETIMCRVKDADEYRRILKKEHAIQLDEETTDFRVSSKKVLDKMVHGFLTFKGKSHNGDEVFCDLFLHNLLIINMTPYDEVSDDSDDE
jgi:hypothetical protein